MSEQPPKPDGPHVRLALVDDGRRRGHLELVTDGWVAGPADLVVVHPLAARRTHHAAADGPTRARS